MEFLLLILVPLFIFIAWNLFKDKSERDSLKPTTSDIVENYMWSPEFHNIHNMLLDFEPTRDLTLSDIPKDILGLGGLLAMAELRAEGKDPYKVPEKERLEKTVECAGSLVGAAKRGEDVKLANVLLAIRE